MGLNTPKNNRVDLTLADQKLILTPPVTAFES